MRRDTRFLEQPTKPVTIRSAAAVNCSINNHFFIPIGIEEINYDVDDVKHLVTTALIDSGASTSFISERIVKDMAFKTYRYEKPVPLQKHRQNP
jgi:hypothetical protein